MYFPSAFYCTWKTIICWETDFYFTLVNFTLVSSPLLASTVNEIWLFRRPRQTKICKNIAFPPIFNSKIFHIITSRGYILSAWLDSDMIFFQAVPSYLVFSYKKGKHCSVQVLWFYNCTTKRTWSGLSVVSVIRTDFPCWADVIIISFYPRGFQSPIHFELNHP